MLVDHLLGMARYWATTSVERPEFQASIKEAGSEIAYRLEGLVHSTLAMFDGCSMAVPALDIVPSPHPEDRAFHRANGENWWPSRRFILGESRLLDHYRERMKGRRVGPK